MNFSVKPLYGDKICCYGTAEQKTSHILGQQLLIVYIYFHIIIPSEPHIIKIITQIKPLLYVSFYLFNQGVYILLFLQYEFGYEINLLEIIDLCIKH